MIRNERAAIVIRDRREDKRFEKDRLQAEAQVCHEQRRATSDCHKGREDVLVMFYQIFEEMYRNQRDIEE